jgi:hypothetical protein
MDETLEQMRIATDPYCAAIREVAGFDMPINTKEKFRSLEISMHTSRSLPILKRLTPEGGSRRDWLTPFLNSREYVKEGMAASYYHYNNFMILEQKIISLGLEKLPNIQTPNGFHTGVHMSNKLDFEYQAFVFALRRTMEYLAISAAAFFKRESHSIRNLQTSIRAAEPKDINDRINAKLDKHLNKLSDILSGADDWSIRDKIAHLKTVNAWMSINYTPDGTYVVEFSIHDIGMDSRPKFELAKKLGDKKLGLNSISPILNNQITRVEDLIFDVYHEMGFQL